MKRLSLTRLVFEARRAQPDLVYPDDPCTEPGCDGTFRVYDSHVDKSGEWRTRYMKCTGCGITAPNKLVEFISRKGSS